MVFYLFLGRIAALSWRANIVATFRPIRASDEEEPWEKGRRRGRAPLEPHLLHQPRPRQHTRIKRCESPSAIGAAITFMLRSMCRTPSPPVTSLPSTESSAATPARGKTMENEILRETVEPPGGQQRKRAEQAGKPMWRKAAGVEPTRERLTSPTGFEAQPHHRIRMPSFGENCRRRWSNPVRP